MAEDITEALHKAIAAERRAFALKRAADPMGRGRTSPAEIKKFRDATAAHDAAKAEVARLRTSTVTDRRFPQAEGRSRLRG